MPEWITIRSHESLSATSECYFEIREPYSISSSACSSFSEVTYFLPKISRDYYGEPEIIYRGRIVYRDSPPVYIESGQTVYVDRPIRKEVPIMWTWTNIAIVAVICIVTVKWILPRLNWRTGIRVFVKLVWRPARKEAKTIKTEWEKANKEDA